MNIISICIILFLFIIGILFLLIRKLKIDQLNKALKEKKYDNALSFLLNSHSKIFLPKYIRGLYIARVYYLEQNINLLKKQLRLMFNTEYNLTDTLTYLNLYYHIFLVREDFSFAKEILGRIEKTDDARAILCNQHAYDIMACNNNDLIQDLEKEIESKYYTDFLLGVATYLIAYQYMRKKENEMALEWFDISLSTLQPNDTYYKKTRLYIESLKDEI